MSSFYVQLGHNGHLVAEELLQEKHAAGVILSPVNYEYADLKDQAETFSKLGGEVLCEPQLYKTRANKPNLPSYPYFKGLSTLDFTSESQRASLLKSVLDVQKTLGVTTLMAPALWPPTYTDGWMDTTAEMTTQFRDIAREMGLKQPILGALPLHGEALANPEIRDHIINTATSLETEGFYLCVDVPEPYDKACTHFASLYGSLAITNGLKENDYHVLACHMNQAGFMFLGAGADGFASGHFLNLRTFTPSRWEAGENEGGGPQATRYFAPKLLNSLRVVPELEQLFARKLLKTVASASPYAEPLLSGDPSKVVWRLKPSWLHFLWSCNQLAQSYRGKVGEQRVQETDSLLAEARLTYDALAGKKIQMVDLEGGAYLEAWDTAWTSFKADVLGME